MTQHDKILALLRQRNMLGINSFIARQELNIIQLPTRIKELKGMGHLITVRQNPDRSVNYILIEEARKQKPEKVEIPQSLSQQEVLF